MAPTPPRAVIVAAVRDDAPVLVADEIALRVLLLLLPHVHAGREATREQAGRADQGEDDVTRTAPHGGLLGHAPTVRARIRPIAMKSATTTIATAMFFSASSFSMSSRGVIQSNNFRPSSRSTNPSRPNAVALIMASRNGRCVTGVVSDWAKSDSARSMATPKTGVRVRTSRR